MPRSWPLGCSELRCCMKTVKTIHRVIYPIRNEMAESSLWLGQYDDNRFDYVQYEN